MLKCVSAYTYELDNPRVAFDEIKAQIDSQITLLRNSVGVVMCHPEFIDAGVAEYVCEALPFDVAGCTTASQAVNSEFGEVILTLFVMTSDDVFFRAGVTDNIDNIDNNINEPVRDAWERADAGAGAPARLALIFPPFLVGPSGDDYVRAWEKLIPGVPIFGTIAAEDALTFSNCKTILNGKSSRYGMAFILCYGAISPRFWLAGISETSRLAPKKGTVTRADGVCVYEIDGMKARTYLAKHEYTGHLRTIDHFRFTPFLASRAGRKDDDETPVMKAITRFTEDGAAIFLSDVDEGSSIMPLSCRYDDLVETAARGAGELSAMPGVNGVLLFSCIVRRMVLMDKDHMSECKAVMAGVRPGIPFMMGYANGEICPTSMRGGVPVNRYHNYTLIMLAV